STCCRPRRRPSSGSARSRAVTRTPPPWSARSPAGGRCEGRAKVRQRPSSRPALGRRLVEDRQGLLGAATDGLLDARPQRLRRALLFQAKLIVVADLEDLGHQAGAHGVALAEVAVDPYLHFRPPADAS